MDSFVQEFDLQIEIRKGWRMCETPWYAHIANYLVTGEIPNQVIRKCVPEEEQQGISSHCLKCMWRPLCLSETAMKVLQSGFTWPSLFKDAHIMCRVVIDAKGLETKYGVKHKVATPYHPQTSGQVELAKGNKEYIDESACHLPVEVEYKLVGNQELNMDLIRAEKEVLRP
ncbi:hypothetical protein CK203_107135 [Vitis vinifera]|uniref:Integrase zinc-binding domain-containing protein n=1 Tax=Vitis vinifera TaxID=29760 RepID=A0A438CVK1_VITVI|nr:hypothetical protein CK203_107135 [Vitis vinifera]